MSCKDLIKVREIKENLTQITKTRELKTDQLLVFDSNLVPIINFPFKKHVMSPIGNFNDNEQRVKRMGLFLIEIFYHKQLFFLSQ